MAWPEVAVVHRLHDDDIQVLRAEVNDARDGLVPSLLVFADTVVADEYVAGTESLSFADGWRAVIVPAQNLIAICAADGISHITIPCGAGLEAEHIGGRVAEVEDRLPERED